VTTAKNVTAQTWTLTYVASDGLYHSGPVPTVPGALTGLLASSITSSSITLTWNAVTSATAYVVSRNGTVIAPADTATTYVDTGLSASTTYTYTVTPVNGYGTGTPASITAGTSAAVASSLVHGGAYSVIGSGFGTRPNYNIGSKDNGFTPYTWTANGNTYTHMHYRWCDFANPMPADGATKAQFMADSGFKGFYFTANEAFVQFPRYGGHFDFGTPVCTITGSVSGNVLTVTGVTSGSFSTPPAITTVNGPSTPWDVSQYLYCLVKGTDPTSSAAYTGLYITDLTAPRSGSSPVAAGNTYTLNAAASIASTTFTIWTMMNIQQLSGGPSQSGKYLYRCGTQDASGGAITIYTDQPSDGAAASVIPATWGTVASGVPSAYASAKQAVSGYYTKGLRYWIDSSSDQYNASGKVQDRIIGPNLERDAIIQDAPSPVATFYSTKNTGIAAVQPPTFYREEWDYCYPNVVTRRNGQTTVYYQTPFVNSGSSAPYVPVGRSVDTWHRAYLMWMDALTNAQNYGSIGTYAVTDIYFDFTAARVEIWQGSGMSTISEPQILLAWTPTRIDYAHNRGQLSSGPATLKVFDATGSVIYSTTVQVA